MPAAATAHDQPGSGACPEQLDAAPDPARKGGAALTVPRQPPSQDDDGIGFLRHVPSGRPQRKWRYPTRAGERSTGGGHMLLYRELMNGLLRGRAGTGDSDHISWTRSEEHTSELQSLMRISYAAF